MNGPKSGKFKKFNDPIIFSFTFSNEFQFFEEQS